MACHLTQLSMRFKTLFKLPRKLKLGPRNVRVRLTLLEVVLSYAKFLRAFNPIDTLVSLRIKMHNSKSVSYL